MKKFLSAPTTLVMLATLIAALTPVKIASAKVIEPEICHVETWTTSYYIDEDKDTLYPYIDCKAEVYNDGKVVVSYWNTHEWDGFATVKHDVTILGTYPFPSNSMEYSFKKGEVYSKDGSNYIPLNEDGKKDYNYWNDIDLNYYPSDYSTSYRFWGGTQFCAIGYKYTKGNGVLNNSIPYPSYKVALPELPVNEINKITFTPEKDVTTTYEFYIFEHILEVTPEMLRGSTIATPQLEPAEKTIKELRTKVSELEEQVRTLSEENENLKVRKLYDFNGDDVVNTLDLVCFIKYLLSV